MDDLPPPYSPTPETLPETYVSASGLPPASVSRWHPKMTPYRISVVITTVILGTFKAVFSYRGISVASTTLEWIAGVVFALLFFVLDELESNKDYPKLLHWFFTFDCADLIWRMLGIFSIPRPRYRSDESKERLHNSTFVPMTGYRILVSTTVVVLGSTKAALAFLGNNTTSNYLDWTLAVFIASLFYCIGLYESNSINMAPNFFVRDHYNIFFQILRDILVILGVAGCLWGSVKCFKFSLWGFKSNVYEFMGSVTPESQSFILVQSLGIFMLCVWAGIVTVAFLGIVASTAVAVWAIQQEPEFFRFLFRRGKFVKYYDGLMDGMLHIKALVLPILRRAWRVASSGLRAGSHLFAIVALISLFFVIVFLMKLFWDGFDVKNGLVGQVISEIVIQLFFGAYAVFVLWGIYYLTRSLISPFRLLAMPNVIA